MSTAVMEPPKVNAVIDKPVAQSPIINIPVSRIVPSPWNRKEDVSPELLASVRQFGVLENLILRPYKATAEDVTLFSVKEDPFKAGDSIFQLVAGERRWKAACKAGRSHVPAAVRPLTDLEAMELQVEENEQRKNFTPMQRADAYDNLRLRYIEAHKGEKGYTEESAIAQIAKSRNCGTRSVYDVISLKKLCAGARAMLQKEEITASHGYELARRSPEEQVTLVNWLYRETQHSQGDMPAVRRLKREIQQLDVEAEEKRRQEKLFKDPQPGTATTPTPTVDEAVYQGAIKLVREVGEQVGRVSAAMLQRRLNVGYTLAATILARMEKEGLVGPAHNSSGDGMRTYIRPKSEAATAQTSAILPAAVSQPKPLSAAEAAKIAKQREKEDLQFKRRQYEFEREERIKKVHRGLFFAALAKKAQINSRFLTHVVPNMIFEVWENALPIEALAQNVLQWPAPKDGHAYTYEEVKSHAAKHTRKFSGRLLAAMILTLYLNEGESLKLSKYMGVDPKRIRKQAEAAVEEEERIARTPKVPSTKHEKQLYRALHHVQNADKRWEKLRRNGASGPELRQFLSDELGHGGGSSAPEYGSVAYKGGSNPAVWFDTLGTGANKKPSLQGAELIATVRDLLKIPEKGDVDA